ncbi:MAG: UDP-3-O-(3-hydroxymyristoyl)glucosamine N-acyltransferase [Nitrospina sp.]|jgi:UDP-3-O-[3-hydroxymyristoyl] glucosamine N-acyltransferase|nr:UDP-3-O-(3-hydroxymyristoyl)glucosamine N-acyltransferase [Nitrospina sp.]MBT3511230.1 UDP-3-O-(3-hydroxymyristoyl)glucosamine N-acyltransferase [Nitrospina sp.]MBT3876426.1 UDP-3-O-(3-hydroxymyristoyl)glucosamine N-acyltransferase [Nitrospina sp.]MBT4047546.1 UDP-3-O-(3-hydroxymyristoyl)glucosamine N-acyltransferase [Nitrospina sp.]MBT4558097.1 UDP-3-O-(3-hydroxymyristoyl)glucosamine N-acyltransferase [Nitrospina sp.]
MKLEKIAELVGGTLKGDGSLEISGLQGLEQAQKGHITFLSKKLLLDTLNRSQVSAVLVKEAVDTSISQVIVASPELAFARLLREFHPEPKPKPGIHDRAVVGENVKLGEQVTLSAGVCVGNDVVIGDHVHLFPNVVVGEGCQIGSHTIIHPNVTLYRNTELGNHVILHSGVVVGADGFGYTLDEKGAHFKINQIGRVVIEDHVEIGANSCIDRAAMGTTRIKQGTKIDNLVQVAHNCTVGEHSILVAQVGLAGSCTLGHHVVLAGQVGVADHVTLGDQVTLAAQSGTFRSIESNNVYGGHPAVPLGEWKKYVTVLPKLPEMARKMRDLEARLKEIEDNRSSQ